MDVKLRNFVAFVRAGVGNVHAHFCGATNLNRFWFDAKIIKTESRIAQAIAKRKQRLPGAEGIAAVGRRLVIVEVGQVSNRARKSDRQFSAWVHVAKEHIRRRRSAFLTQIPTFKYRWNMFCDVVDGEGPAVNQEDNRRSPGFDDGFDEIILRAQQLKRIAVAAMIFRPGFAVRALVFADYNNGHFGALTGVNRGFDVVRLRTGIYQFHIVVEPAMPVLMFVSEPAAFGINHFGLGSDPVLNTLKDRYSVRRHAAVAAEVKAVGIRTDYGNGFDFAQVEREQLLFVLQ